MTLTEFLLARIHEDEVAAMASEGPWRRKRMLAECEAKRRLIGARAAISIPDTADCPNGQGFVWLDGAHTAVAVERERTLSILALPYADHPDYDEAWRA